jgi:hypothetical protein
MNGLQDDQNRQVLEALWGADEVVLSAEAEYALRTDDYVMEMPQSGERIVGRANMRAMQAAFPSPPTVTIRRIVGSGDLFVVEMVSEYPGGGTYHVANIVEFRVGKIARETRYYAEPFEAPAWRAAWVEANQGRGGSPGDDAGDGQDGSR